MVKAPPAGRLRNSSAGECDGLGDGDGLREGDLLGDGLGEGDLLGDGEGLGEGDLLGDGDGLGDGEGLGEGDLLGDGDGTGDGDPVAAGAPAGSDGRDPTESSGCEATAANDGRARAGLAAAPVLPRIAMSIPATTAPPPASALAPARPAR